MFETIKPSPIALAYARREYDEEQHIVEILTNYTGYQPEDENEEQRERDVWESALRVEKILQFGNSKVGLAIETNYGRRRLAHRLAQSFEDYAHNNPNSTIDVDSIGFTVEPMADEEVRLIFWPTIIWSVESIPLLCSSAIRLGQEKQTSPESVFEEDQLYEELIRKSYQPAEFLKPILQTAQNFTLEAWSRVYASNFRGLMQVLTGDQPNEIDLRGMSTEEIRLGLLSDPDMAKDLDQYASSHRMAFEAMARVHFKRFWADADIGSLPEDLREFLLKDTGSNQGSFLPPEKIED